MVPSGADVQIHYKWNWRQDIINHRLDCIRVVFEEQYKPIERISMMETWSESHELFEIDGKDEIAMSMGINKVIYYLQF